MNEPEPNQVVKQEADAVQTTQIKSTDPNKEIKYDLTVEDVLNGIRPLPPFPKTATHYS